MDRGEMRSSHGWKWRIKEYDVIDSTNKEARRLVKCGEGPGLVVWARQQTGGKGRFGRSWWSLPGKSLLTSLVFDKIDGLDATRLVSVAAIAAIARKTGEGPKIKWPNDLVYDNRKVAGILTEYVAFRGRQFVIVGLGVNVGYLPEELEAHSDISFTSLLVEEKSFWDIKELLFSLLDELDLRLKKGSLDWFEEYRNKLAYVNQTVTVKPPYTIVGERQKRKKEISGVMEGVDVHGYLILRLKDITYRIAAGDMAAGTED